MKIVLGFGVLLVLILSIILMPVFRLGNTPIDSGTITIPKGTTLYGLQSVLGLDTASWKYKIWLKRNYPDFQLSAGTYPIGSGVTLDTLFDEVLRYQPKADDIAITILPGWHIGEVDAYLQNTMGVSGLVLNQRALLQKFSSDFAFLEGVSSLEGFLYPDTYRVYPDATLEQVVSVMLAGFEKQIYNSYSGETGDLSFYDTLKLASIIEEEEKSSTNRPMVADVYKKRLRDNWQLGADATLCYEGLIPGDACRKFVNEYYALGLSDRQAKGYVYDTRISVGLPPTPISSVSVSSFDAVVNSKDNPYYYYLHDSSGNIHFGVDAADHAANKQKYIY